VILLHPGVGELVSAAYQDEENWTTPGPSSVFPRCHEGPLVDWWRTICECKVVRFPVDHKVAVAMMRCRGMVAGSRIGMAPIGAILVGGADYAWENSYGSLFVRKPPFLWGEFPTKDGRAMADPPIYAICEVKNSTD
jgi:hypothetical protein